ncbi:hypothetical protein [Streptococcus suis]|nr:hypothetical protein [Streptococcus suis]
MSYYYEKSTGKVAKHLARFPYYATDKILNLYSTKIKSKPVKCF